MAASSSDLCTVQEVRDYLQIPTGDTEQDTVIQALVTRASVAINHHCDRRFLPVETAAVKTFEYPGDGVLSVAPYDIQSVTLVRLDPDLSPPTTLAATQYRLFPYPATDGGVYSGLLLRCIRGERLVEVTGTFGWSSIPEHVKQAAIVTVGTWMRRDVAAFSTVFKLDEDAVERPEALPSAVRGMLTDFKRRHVH